MRCGGPGGRTIAATAVVALAVLAGCSGGSSGDTLSPINGSAGTAAAVTTPSGSGPTPGTAVDAASAGSGFVQVQVQVGSTGVNETLSLDRATVRKDSLDPASLNATCTPLDGGDTSKGIDVTVVDLRTLLPLDVHAILETAARTGKVIVLHEATRTGGVGGEVAALIAERAFEYLDAPVVRVAAPDTPVPYSPPLEAAFIPDAARVGKAIRALHEY